LAKSYYTGAGKIVDAGAFLGGSAYCFGYGLSENDNIEDKNKRIESYDMFKSKGKYYLDFIRVNFLTRQQQPGVAIQYIHDLPEEEYDFEELYRFQTARYEDYININKGDFTKMSWDKSNPIEILFIDLAKAKKVNDHCVTEFFECLIPGKSVLIQQDYYSMLTYLHLIMEYFDDHFEFVADAGGGSRSFICTKAISASQAETAVAEYTDPVKGSKLYETLLGKVEPRWFPHMNTAYIHFLQESDDFDKAGAELKKLLSDKNIDSKQKANWTNVVNKQLIPRWEKATGKTFSA